MSKKIRIILLTLILAFTCVLNINLFCNTVYAEINSTIDNTDIMQDFLSMDKNIRLNYPKNVNAEPKIQIINFVEYAYSAIESKRTDYSLYVYVYNPTLIDINTNTLSNQIQLGVKYDTYNITKESTVTDWDKFALQFVSASSDNLYLKFRIFDHISTDRKTIEKIVNPNFRRYDISSIELFEKGKQNAFDYAINQIYVYTGYSQGMSYNENAEDTLNATCYNHFIDTETISLNVNHTYYRTLSSSKGAGYQNQIDTVYFTVPEHYFDYYGRLQKIKAEWYEFMTNDIIVTDNLNLFNLLYQYVGNSKFADDNILATTIATGLGNSSVVGPFIFAGDNCSALVGNSNQSQRNTVDSIYWYFHTKDWANIENYDSTQYAEDIGGISCDDLLNYIYSYNKTYVNGALEIKDKTISADLFQSDIQEDRKLNNQYGVIQSGFNGKSYYDFDADIDLFSFTNWGDFEHSFWENWKNWGFWNALFGQIPDDTGLTDVTPIYVVTREDMSLSDEKLSKKLLVNINDIQYIRTAYENANSTIDANGQPKERESLVLFRFALSDYYSSNLCWYYGFDWVDSVDENCVYNARETVFLDFDIIQLTFQENGTKKIIPVVASPIDIVVDVTPPYTGVDLDFSWLWRLILLILLLILLWPFLPTILIVLCCLVKNIVSAIVKIIRLPFDLIKKGKKYKKGGGKK